MAAPLGLMAAGGFEQVTYCHDPRSGLRAIIAIHSTALGPALGGTRVRAYPDEAAALVDVCRLARGMTYKHAAAGLDHGGGKAVIIGEPATARTEESLRAYARFVHGLSGRYITAEDVGTTQADMDLIREETPHVTGVSESLGGSGDPSPATALGVRWAMRAVAARHFGDADLAGRHVCIVGVGKVGAALARLLHRDGARLTVADVRPEAVAAVVRDTGAEAVPVEKAHAVECDVLSPCALGGLLSAERVADLRCAAVVGSANNQLATDEDGDRVAARGIVYVPDYVANAGGVINIAEERGGYDRHRAERRIEGIFHTVGAILDHADRDGITPAAAADRLAERRIAAAAGASATAALTHTTRRP